MTYIVSGRGVKLYSLTHSSAAGNRQPIPMDPLPAVAMIGIWLACGTPLSRRRRRRSQICYQDGVDVYSVSNVAIGFPLFRNWKLIVKG